ncbi:hypothetical protein Tco_0091444 [Tanacetum coccineum]
MLDPLYETYWGFMEVILQSLYIQIQKVYEFKRFLNRLNDDDVIVVSHEDAQATLSDANDPFTSISMSKDLAD